MATAQADVKVKQEDIMSHAVAPPPGPPPLLSQEQITALCWNGWIEIDLNRQLDEQIQKLQKAAFKYFTQDQATKLQQLGTRASGDEGYYNVPGVKEYITFRRSIDDKQYLELVAKAVWKEVARLLHRALCDLSRAGQLPAEAWNDVMGSGLGMPDANANLDKSTTLMRLFKYEPMRGIADKHSDLGLLTMCVSDGEGLQLLDRHGLSMSWYPVKKCTILVGESLRALSNNHVRTGIHRVVANPQGRQSFVFALRPDLTNSVNLEDFGGRGKVHLKEMFNKIKGSKYNVNATAEVQQQQRAQQQQQRLRLVGD